MKKLTLRIAMQDYLALDQVPKAGDVLYWSSDNKSESVTLMKYDIDNEYWIAKFPTYSAPLSLYLVTIMFIDADVVLVANLPIEIADNIKK